MADAAPPLDGLRVLDFTTLLPGPLATLMLADAGASVLKIERPPAGDGTRANVPRAGGESVQFALLNRGKRSMVLDLRLPEHLARARRLAGEADVLVEQFRPGVMDRLGLGWRALHALNPRLIYCSITGYGQDGPLAGVAGHDLNYIARSGLLALSVDADGRPVLPQAAFADVGGGSLPAVVNILMALLRRAATGEGSRLDVAMAENTLAWLPRALAPAMAGLGAPDPRRGRHTGGSPRYGVYVAADGAPLAVAALEARFWARFCELIGLPPGERDDRGDPMAVGDRVAAILARHDAAHWLALFEGEDVCVSGVQDVAQALADAHFAARGMFDRRVRLPDGSEVAALPSLLARDFLAREPAAVPAVGSTPPDAEDPWCRTG
jgi:alpha-methylacyl-CoA racemase